MSDYQSPESQQPRRHRNRQTLVCRSCRNKKIKCDRRVPCGPCQKSKSQCIYRSTRKSPQPASLFNHDVAPSSASPRPNVFRSIDTLSDVISSAPHSSHVAVAHESSSTKRREHELHSAATQSPPQPDPFIVDEPCFTEEPSLITDVSPVPDGTYSKTRLFGRSHWMHALARV